MRLDAAETVLRKAFLEKTLLERDATGAADVIGAIDVGT
jgi:hypothetical protein